MKKMRDRILITLLIVGMMSVLPIAAIGVNTIFQSSKAQAQSFGEKSASYNSQIISTWLNEKMKLLISLKKQLTGLEHEEDIKNYLRIYSQTDSDIISIFAGFEDNVMIDAYEWIPPQGYSVVDRPWYIEAKGKENAVTSVYLDQNKNEYVIAIASDIRIKDRDGVLAANIYADYVEKIVDEIKFGDTGFAMLLDNYNQLICHNSDNEKSILFKRILNALESRYGKLGNGVTYDIELEGIAYLATFSSVGEYGWKLFLVAPLADFTKQAQEMVTKFVFIISLVILLIAAMDYLISKSISKPIDRLIFAITNLANGEFDVEIKSSSKDEIGMLTTAIDRMRHNLRKIFESMKYESKLITMSSNALTNHLNETYLGTNRFMSMLSHDIKTPITLIKGYAMALESGIAGAEKNTEYIEKMKYRVDQIEMIVKDVLDNTYEVNDLKVNLQKVSCNDYVNIIRYNAESFISDQNRELLVSVDLKNLSVRSYVSIDVVKIQRVINNILSNAIKFSENQTQVHLYILQMNGRLLTYVSDKGSGIKDSDKDKVFNMFYKADESKGGYGLGLYINKAIIDAHKGEIFIESDYGVGSSIGYYLDVIEMS